MKGVLILDDLMRSIEPHFLYSQSRELVSPSVHSSEVLLRYINYKITQRPESITQHVRKIKLLQASSFDYEVLFSALVDLFILLKDKGLELRRRMLLSSKEHLTRVMFAKLQAKLKAGGMTERDCWAGGLSMLATTESSGFSVCISEVNPRALGGSRYGL